MTAQEQHEFKPGDCVDGPENILDLVSTPSAAAMSTIVILSKVNREEQ